MAATRSNSSAVTVARIAGLASSSVVQVVQHDSPTAEHFASGLQHAELYSAHSAQINKVALNADPASELSRVLRATSKSGSATSLVSLLAQSNTHLLTSLVPQLVHVVATPTVLHIATQGDQSDVMALRSSGLVILHSSSPTQAHDHALLASRLAVSRSTAVLHFFNDQEGAVQDEITDADVHALLTKQTLVDGHAENGNGHTNGNSAEASNGQSNGTATPRIPPTTPEDLSRAIDDAFKVVSDTVGRKVEPFSFYGSESASQLAVVLGAGAELLGSDNLAVIRVNLVRPLIDESLRAYVPASVTKVATLDQSLRRTTRISPLLVDVVTALQRAQAMGGVPGQDKAVSVELPKVLISGTLGDITESNAGQASSAVGAALEAGQNGFTIGDARSASAPAAVAAKPPKHEEAYQVILQQLFNARLAVVNSPLNENDQSPAALSPEYAFGKVVAQLEGRESFDRAARALLQDPRNVSKDLQTALKQFTLDGKRDTATAEKVQSLLRQSDAPASLSQLASSIDGKSRWIVGSDAWAYDVGMGGVHHVIASGKNVNLLIFDSLPYSERDAVEAHKRKKDIGLYAMNYGNVYVASTAVYANYTQVLQALMEADRFDGPSIVLAYVPYLTQDAPALDVLRETKLAVDSGYWPLYRWDPSAEKSGNEVFRLDSMRIRQQLNAFLERNNHLTLLANAKPELAYDLVSSQGTGLRERQRQKAKEAYDALLGAMDGPPLLILYASDGGNAEKVAKKLSLRAKARGLAARLLPMDDFPAGEELKGEKNVAFITSTAGQGEAPQNGRETMKTLNKMSEGSLKSDSSASSSASTKGDEEEEGLRYTVFAMGDSHYWPRAEDAHYYNKSGKDLDARLDALGAKRFVPLGLGDDQDADGYQTGYKVWEPLLWKALGVDSIEVIEAEPEPITNENIKIASNYLRGTILEGLADKSTGAIAESDGQLTKFHGTYQQYDRDTFDERKAAGLEPAYSFMIRCRIPGGVTTPAQWVQLDKVAGQYGNQTMKITTRQTIQYHCIVKSDLKAAMQGINKAMLDTIAACGDVNRNVMCSPNPHLSNLHAEVFEFSKGISEYLLPRMDAYHEIWLDKDTESKKELLMGGALKDYEPMYGPYYLPRKFKIAIAVPPRNDTDCFAHDIGLIAIADKKGHLSGFNVSVGGGMGVTHGVKATYPRLGDVIGFATTEQVKDVCKEIMLTQRDYGNRSNRKQARLKYTIDNHFKGPDNFRAEVERRLGYELGPARPYTFTANTDEYGWRKQSNGNWTCMLWLENGRIRDAPGEPFRTGVRELCLAKWFDGELRMTPNQHLALCEIKPEIKARVEVHLDMYNMVLWKQSAIATSASSCVAFPTCGLAMAESERVLFPDLVEKLDKIVKRLGLAAEEIITRMTGCPNGCARPWVAHIAFVGKAPETYLMLLGGNKRGTRINKVYAESVTLPEAIKMLEPMLERFAKEKGDGEDFGDFLIRVGIIAETKQGKDFWDGIRPLPLPVLATSG